MVDSGTGSAACCWKNRVQYTDNGSRKRNIRNRIRIFSSYSTEFELGTTLLYRKKIFPLCNRLFFCTPPALRIRHFYSVVGVTRILFFTRI